MPVYVIRCGQCGSRDEVVRSIKGYDDLPEHCGQKMERVVTPALVMTDLQPYKSMIDGSMISSRSQHRAHLKQHNCIEIGNETKYLQTKASPPPGLKETLIRVVKEKTGGL